MLFKLSTYYHFYKGDKYLFKDFKDEIYSTNSQGLTFHHGPPKKEKSQIKYV